jgi:hypothetical protein
MSLLDNGKVLNDTDPMPWGLHQGTPMQDVPARYMFWLWTAFGLEAGAERLKSGSHPRARVWPGALQRGRSAVSDNPGAPDHAVAGPRIDETRPTNCNAMSFTLKQGEN